MKLSRTDYFTFASMIDDVYQTIRSLHLLAGGAPIDDPDDEENVEFFISELEYRVTNLSSFYENHATEGDNDDSEDNT